MKYIELGTSFRVGIIPRKTMFPINAETYTSFLYNETTKEIQSSEPYDLYEDGDIFYFKIEADLVLNTFYELTIISDTQKIIYKDRLYCTDQNITDFSINDGVYISAETNQNNYITI